MWIYVDETSIEPKDKKDEETYVKKLETCDVSNSKILTWINNSASQSISGQLEKIDIFKGV